jgi:hypothetical protein
VSKLDSALGELDGLSGTGVDTAGMGRRAKRHAEAAALAAKAGFVPAPGAGGAASAAAGSPSGAASGFSAASALAEAAAKSGSRRAVAAAARGKGSGGRRGGGRGGDSDSDSGDGCDDGGSGPAIPASRVVEYDPLAITVNNKAHAAELDRLAREELRAKSDAEKQRHREMQEAARAAKEWARNNKARGGAAAAAAAATIRTRMRRACFCRMPR